VREQLRLALFRWGLPVRFRVDNGNPWGSWGDFPTALALWVIGLGVGMHWNHPRRPQENGVVERSQGTSNRWCEPWTCATPQELQARLDQIDRLYRERVRRDLDSDRLDRAVHDLRLARARTMSKGVKAGPDLVSLGIETFTRAADRLEAHGRLGMAADWDDSLFVFAVRAEQPHHRFAAVAAFVEGLDLRVREGNPCEALARVTWAKRGLGGVIPGFQPSLEEDLVGQCRDSRRNRRT